MSPRKDNTCKNSWNVDWKLSRRFFVHCSNLLNSWRLLIETITCPLLALIRNYYGGLLLVYCNEKWIISQQRRPFGKVVQRRRAQKTHNCNPRIRQRWFTVFLLIQFIYLSLFCFTYNTNKGFQNSCLSTYYHTLIVGNTPTPPFSLCFPPTKVLLPRSI